MTHDEKKEYGKMILLALDGLMDNEQFAEFDRKLREDASFRHYYLEFMSVNSSLNAIDKFPVRRYPDDSFIDSEILNLFAEIENNSPAIIFPEECDAEGKAEVGKIVHKEIKTNKFFRIYNRLVSAAAVLLLAFILYAHIFPPKYSVPVATVTDQVGVKWKSSSEKLVTGGDLLTNQPPYILEKGIVKIAYHQGVNVVIEGPAEFQILTEDRLGLKSGKVYSVVAKEGTGFSVYTQNAKVVDLGTEFGVYADSNGDTSIHVIKGKTMLIAGNESDTVSLSIEKGYAKRVLANKQTIADISCEEELFVREIDSNSNFIWRGRNYICLADIVSGGDGFGAGRKDYGIDILTGNLQYFPETRETYDKNNKYVLAKNIKYIDGVFVPNGGVENPVITSTGISFSGFPKTGGEVWGGVFNGCFHMSYNVKRHNFRMNGREYGYKSGEASICMHSNKGITFSLDAIRSDINAFQLNGFSTEVAVSETSLEYLGENSTNKIDFYVIVDGQQRYCNKEIDPGSGLVKVEVPIQESDRFLTLAVTESNDGAAFDWCYLKDPKLSLTGPK